MKKILVLVSLCVMSVCSYSCSGTSSSKNERDEVKRGQYTAPDGSKQKHYKGSLEQQQDLAEIDAYFDEHGWE